MSIIAGLPAGFSKQRAERQLAFQNDSGKRILHGTLIYLRRARCNSVQAAVTRRDGFSVPTQAHRGILGKLARFAEIFAAILGKDCRRERFFSLGGANRLPCNGLAAKDAGRIPSEADFPNRGRRVKMDKLLEGVGSSRSRPKWSS